MKTLSINKGLLFAIVGLAVIASIVGYQFVEARFTDNTFDQIVQTAEAVDNFQISMELPNLSAPTTTVLVSLENVADFPHARNAGSIEVSKIWGTFSALPGSGDVVSIPPNEATTTVLQFGVIASSTPTGDLTDIVWFDSVNYNALEDGLNKTFELTYTPSVISLALNSASTTRLLSNVSDLATSDYATTSSLTSPQGTGARPRVGDLVMKVDSIFGNATVTANALYKIK